MIYKRADELEIGNTLLLPADEWEDDAEGYIVIDIKSIHLSFGRVVITDNNDIAYFRKPSDRVALAEPDEFRSQPSILEV